MIHGNKHAARAEKVQRLLGEDVIAVEGITDATIIATAIEANTEATLALVHEQHQRNRLAAITAVNRAISLPPDLQALTTEGTPS